MVEETGRGTCRFAREWYYPPSTGGRYDGVNCTSEAMAALLDTNYRHNVHQNELAEYDSINLWRPEKLIDIEYIREGEKCACWMPKEIAIEG